MSWLAKRIWLASLGLVFLISCKKPDSFGFDDNELPSEYVDTLTINVSTVLVDSSASDNFDKLLLGDYQDPVLGMVHATSFFQLRLSPNSDSIGSDPQLISAKLVMDASPDYYNKTGETYQLKYFLYQLDEELDENADYQIFDSLPYSATDVLTASDRSVVEAAFGQKLLNAVANKASQSDFDADIKGVAFVADPAITSAIMRYQLSNNSDSSTNYIALEYSFQDSVPVVDVSTGDTISWTVSTATGTYNLLLDQRCKRFSRIWSDRQGSAVESLVNIRDEVSGDSAYIQSGVGLRIRLNFPTIQKYFQDQGNVALNKVELSFEIEDDGYEAPATIGVGDLEGQNAIDFASLSGNTYTFADFNALNPNNNMLLLFQKMYEEDVYEDLLITSFVKSNVERAIIHHTKNNPSVKLKIYYTELND